MDAPENSPAKIPDDNTDRVTCGVVVTDGERLVIGHSTGNTHWDIPKGLAEPGETEIEAAARELDEEAGLRVSVDDLVPLGRFPFASGKDLALFLLYRDPLPDPVALHCRSMVVRPDRSPFPEIDQFDVVPWSEVPNRCVLRMMVRLADVRPAIARTIAGIRQRTVD